MLLQKDGLIVRITARAKDKEVKESFSLLNIGARITMLCIKPARTAEGDAPVMKTKNQI